MIRTTLTGRRPLAIAAVIASLSVVGAAPATASEWQSTPATKATVSTVSGPAMANFSQPAHQPRLDPPAMPAGSSAKRALAIAPAKSSALPPHASPPDDWPTYHHDASRSGFDPVMGTFNGVKAGWASPTTVDGDVYAEPLVVGTTVIIATENNTVYGLNAATGAVAWSRSINPTGYTAVPAATMPCGDVDPVGITSTPVADPTAGLVYVVGIVYSGTAASIHYVLAAIQISSGAVSWSRTLTIAGFDPTIQNQRGALSLANGTLYIPFGGRAGDCGNYHGFLFATPATAGGGVTYFQSTTDPAGGFWQPAGPSMDSQGNIYITSGNSYDTGTYDGGETVFELSPSLSKLSYFAPADWQNLNAGDTDLGSTDPLPVGSNLIFQVGKAGVGYVLYQGNLGGIGGQVASGQVCTATTDAAFGGLAYVYPYIYIPCSDGVVALTLSESSCQLTLNLAWGPPTSPSTFASPPIVAGGLLWIMDRGGQFYALNPTTGATVFNQNLGAADHFVTPAAGDGAVFVAATNQVYSFVSNGPMGLPPTGGAGPSPFNLRAPWWCPSPNAVQRTKPTIPWWRH